LSSAEILLSSRVQEHSESALEAAQEALFIFTSKSRINAQHSVHSRTLYTVVKPSRILQHAQLIMHFSFWRWGKCKLGRSGRTLLSVSKSMKS
jgi:hypothetical protein